MDGVPGDITVSKTDFPVQIIESAQSDSLLCGTLLLLPLRVDSRGRFQFRSDEAGLVKTARAAGIPLAKIRAGQASEYVSEYSAGQLLFDIAIGVMGNLTTDCLKHIVGTVRIRLGSVFVRSPMRDCSDRVRIKIAQVKVTGDRRELHGVDVDVPVRYFEESDDRVAELLGRIVDLRALGDEEE